MLAGSCNSGRGEAAAKEVGPSAVALQLDVTDGDSIAAAAERIRQEFGRLDLLVNNAGIPKTTQDARIVDVSSGVGSLTTNADPACPHHAYFDPIYPASKTALNGYAGTESVEDGSRGP